MPGEASGPQPRSLSDAPGLTSLVERAGLDPAQYDEGFFRHRGAFNLYEVFSDGELEVVTASGGDEHRDDAFYDGFMTLHEQARSDNELRHELDTLASWCGSLLSLHVEAGHINIDDLSSMVKPDVSSAGELSVALGDYVWTPRHDEPSVLDYGPGIAGLRFVQAHAKARARDRPFTYYGVTDGSFVRSFLTQEFLTRERQYEAMRGATGEENPGFSILDIGMQQFTEIITVANESSDEPLLQDLIIFSRLHHADRRQLKATIRRSSQLLKPEGQVMLAAPLESIRGDATATFGEQFSWAQHSGYRMVQRMSDEWNNLDDAHMGLAVLERA